MFEIGFQEAALIGIIALLIVGPERLPAMAREIGLWAGRLRRYVSHVRDDIEREVRAQELHDLMRQSGQGKDSDDGLSDDLYDLVEETKSDLRTVEKEWQGAAGDTGGKEAPPPRTGTTPASAAATPAPHPTPDPTPDPTPGTAAAGNHDGRPGES